MRLRGERKKYLETLSSSLTLLLALSFFTACFPQPSPLEVAERRKTFENLMSRSVLAFRLDTLRAQDEAEALLKLAEELEPRSARVADGYGCLALRRGDLNKAQEHFHEARRRDPLYARAHAHLAYIAQRKGELEQAESLYETSLKLKPLDARTRWNYASFLYTHRSKQAGQRELQKALSLLSVEEIESLKQAFPAP